MMPCDVRTRFTWQSQFSPVGNPHHSGCRISRPNLHCRSSILNQLWSSVTAFTSHKTVNSQSSVSLGNAARTHLYTPIHTQTEREWEICIKLQQQQQKKSTCDRVGAGRSSINYMYNYTAWQYIDHLVYITVAVNFAHPNLVPSVLWCNHSIIIWCIP